MMRFYDTYKMNNIEEIWAKTYVAFPSPFYRKLR